MSASHAEAQNHIISVVEGSRDGRQIDLANGRWMGGGTIAQSS